MPDLKLSWRLKGSGPGRPSCGQCSCAAVEASRALHMREPAGCALRGGGAGERAVQWSWAKSPFYKQTSATPYSYASNEGKTTCRLADDAGQHARAGRAAADRVLPQRCMLSHSADRRVGLSGRHRGAVHSLAGRSAASAAASAPTCGPNRKEQPPRASQRSDAGENLRMGRTYFRLSSLEVDQ